MARVARVDRAARMARVAGPPGWPELHGPAVRVHVANAGVGICDSACCLLVGACGNWHQGQPCRLHERAAGAAHLMVGLGHRDVTLNEGK